MRLVVPVVFFTLQIGLCLAEITDYEACHFVGARLARVRSVPTFQGTCSNMKFDSKSVFPSVIARFRDPGVDVSVKTAAELMSATLRTVTGLATPLEIEDMFAILDEITSGFRNSLLTHQPLGDSVLESMRAVEEGLYSLAFKDWNDWRDIYSQQIVQSSQIDNIKVWMNHFVDNFEHLGDASDSTISVLVYSMNLWAILPNLMPSSVSLTDQVSLILLSESCSYKSTQTDGATRSSDFDMLVRENGLEISKSVNIIINRPNDLVKNDLENLGVLIALWDVDKFTSASESILVYLVESNICHQLDEFIFELEEQGHASFAWLGVFLFKICSLTRFYDFDRTMQMSLSLGRLQHGVYPHIRIATDIDRNEILGIISDESLPWIGGLSTEPSQNGWMKTYILFNHIDESSGLLVPDMNPEFRQFVTRSDIDENITPRFEKLMTGLGKVLGFSLRYGTSLKILNLSPRSLQRLGGPLQGDSDDVAESYFWIRFGIRQTAGPLFDAAFLLS